MIRTLAIMSHKPGLIDDRHLVEALTVKDIDAVPTRDRGGDGHGQLLRQVADRQLRPRLAGHGGV